MTAMMIEVEPSVRYEIVMNDVALVTCETLPQAEDMVDRFVTQAHRGGKTPRVYISEVTTTTRRIT